MLGSSIKLIKLKGYYYIILIIINFKKIIKLFIIKFVQIKIRIIKCLTRIRNF